MAAERIFVGRKAELEQFKKVLEDLRGQAILVAGKKVTKVDFNVV